MIELLLSVAVGTLTGAGIWLLCKARTFEVILGLTLWSYAVNLMLFAAGRLRVAAPPILQDSPIDPTRYADPLPQALVLTAIVIGFAMTALVVALALRLHGSRDDDRIDMAHREDEA